MYLKPEGILKWWIHQVEHVLTNPEITINNCCKNQESFQTILPSKNHFWFQPIKYEHSQVKGKK